MKWLTTCALALVLTMALGACRSVPLVKTPAPQVDLSRFMGSWYVIGSIATPLEKDTYNAVERYELDEDGTIDTTFTYRKGGFDGKPKKIKARGFVRDTTTNAVWGMQFFWPIKSDYRIAWLAEDYSRVVVAREKRDYVWIMARTPTISEAEYEELARFVQSLGYDTSLIRRTPQDGKSSPKP